MFKVGDMAVYPAHGVGVVEAIENKEISGSTNKFYILRLLNNGMTIMIPTNNADSVGLREIIPNSQVPQVYEILKDKEKKSVRISQTWNRRYREYSEKIRTGSVFEIAEVLRDLNLLKLQKDLSYGEKKILDTARNLLTRELALATNTEKENIEEEIKLIFNY